MGQHIAIESENAELRAGAADGRIAETEMRCRVVRLEAVAHHRPIRSLDRVGRVGTPRERGAEEDDIEARARLSPGIELGKGAALGFRRQGR